MKSLNHTDRFELLSAYVDQELDASDKKLVEQWLKEDPTYREQYRQLLQVQKLLIDLPVPNTLPSEVLVNQVMTKITKRSHQRWGLIAGGTALIATVFSLGSYQYQQLKLAEATSSEEQLILAMEVPIIPLPSSSSNGR